MERCSVTFRANASCNDPFDDPPESTNTALNANDELPGERDHALEGIKHTVLRCVCMCVRVCAAMQMQLGVHKTRAAANDSSRNVRLVACGWHFQSACDTLKTSPGTGWRVTSSKACNRSLHTPRCWCVKQVPFQWAGESFSLDDCHRRFAKPSPWIRN